MSELTTDGFSAWVSIDDVKLPQYGVETTVIKGVKTVSCWIASEVDKAFIAGYSIPASPEGLSGVVYIDGMKIGTSIHGSGRPGIIIRSSMRVSDTVARPLVFSRTEFTDEDTYLDVGPTNLGEITIMIWAVKNIRPDKPIYSASRQQPTKIHEHTKKAISHRATLGEEIAVTATPKGDFLRCKRVRHVMSFIFKYRSRDYLQAEGIIPLGPEPNARPHKRAAEILEPNAESGDEGEADVQARNEELRLRQEELRVQKESLEVQKEEMQLQIQKEELKLRIRKEELRIQAEELKIQLDAVKAKTKTQRKKAKMEPQEATLRVKTETIDLT